MFYLQPTDYTPTEPFFAIKVASGIYCYFTFPALSLFAILSVLL